LWRLKVIGRLAYGMGKTHRDIRGRCLFVGDHYFQPLGRAMGRQFQLRIESLTVPQSLHAEVALDISSLSGFPDAISSQNKPFIVNI
jgi:hypothetical protein